MVPPSPVSDEPPLKEAAPPSPVVDDPPLKEAEPPPSPEISMRHVTLKILRNKQRMILKYLPAFFELVDPALIVASPPPVWDAWSPTAEQDAKSKSGERKV